MRACARPSAWTASSMRRPCRRSSSSRCRPGPAQAARRCGDDDRSRPAYGHQIRSNRFVASCGTPGLVPEWMTGATPGQELVTEISGARPDGRFVDYGAVHMLTTGALAGLARRLGRSAVDAARFRPNLVLDAARDPSPVRSCRSGTSCCGWCFPRRGASFPAWPSASRAKRFAVFYTKVHNRLLRPLLAADRPPAPLPVRQALRTLGRAGADYVSDAHDCLKLGSNVDSLATQGR